MLLAAALLCAGSLPADASTVESYVGTVKVSGTSLQRVIGLMVEGSQHVLKGEPVAELERLASIKVEVLGRPEEGGIQVKSYRILDVGGGAKPLVGILAESSAGLLLRDGDGDGIALSLPSRSKRRLTGKIGAKIWIHGKQLVSGEYKVKRYGILKDAPQSAPQ